MLYTEIQAFPNNSSFLYIGHVSVKTFVDISNRSDVLDKVIVYCPQGDRVTSDANIKAIKDFASDVFDIITKTTEEELTGKSALVIREEAHGGQLAGFLE